MPPIELQFTDGSCHIDWSKVTTKVTRLPYECKQILTVKLLIFMNNFHMENLNLKIEKCILLQACLHRQGYGIQKLWSRDVALQVGEITLWAAHAVLIAQQLKGH